MNSKKTDRTDKSRQRATLLAQYRWQLIAGGVVLLLATLIAVNAIAPRLAAEHYNQAIAQPVSDLRAAFTNLEKRADLPVDLTQGGARGAAAEKQLQADIQQAREALDQLELTNTSLRNTPLSFGNEAYHEARVTQRERTYMIGQSRAILQHYEALIQHLIQRVDHHAVVTGHLDRINAVIDLNALTGQAARLRTTANDISQAAEAVNKLGPIPGTVYSGDSNLAAYRQASDGFRQLAAAVEAGDDNATLAAVQTLEAVTATLNQNSNAELIAAIQESATIREIRSIREKLPLSRD